MYKFSTNDLEIFERIKGPLHPFDKYLLKKTYEKYLYPPSKKPYNLRVLKKGSLRNGYLYVRKEDKSWNANYEIIKSLYPHKSKPGFFVEAGAYDGEHLSNTIYLEVDLGWSGLLVEPSKSNEKKILAKNRRAWFCPCCLSTKSFPHSTILQTLFKEKNQPQDMMNSMYESSSNNERTKFGKPEYEEVQCLPLQTLLKAINQTHVDLISLDVEDVEEQVLNSFSWDEIDVDVWLVEHRHPDTDLLNAIDKLDSNFIKWFEDKGYVLYKTSILYLTDYVFVKKESKFYKENKKRLQLD